MKYSKGKKRIYKILKIVLIVLVALPLILTLVGFVVMSLWNWLIPTLFGGPVITFWQALGLLILSKILFGGFKGGGHHKRPNKWEQKWKQKFSDMSPERRDVLKAKLASKWGCHEWHETDTEESEKEEK